MTKYRKARTSGNRPAGADHPKFAAAAAWLGAGVVGLGIGAALTCGSGIAQADNGSGADGSSGRSATVHSHSSESKASTSATTKTALSPSYSRAAAGAAKPAISTGSGVTGTGRSTVNTRTVTLGDTQPSDIPATPSPAPAAGLKVASAAASVAPPPSRRIRHSDVPTAAQLNITTGGGYARTTWYTSKPYVQVDVSAVDSLKDGKTIEIQVYQKPTANGQWSMVGSARTTGQGTWAFLSYSLNSNPYAIAVRIQDGKTYKDWVSYS